MPTPQTANPCCSSCAAPLSRRVMWKISKGLPTTGLCAPCWKVSVRTKPRHCIDCGKQIANRKAKRCHPCVNRMMAQDARREAHRLDRMREVLKRPEVQHRRAEGCRAAARRKMAWLPDHHRDEYFKLLNKFGRAELAKAEIRARMTPFERQLSLVMEGSATVREFKLRTTLGGVPAGVV